MKNEVEPNEATFWRGISIEWIKSGGNKKIVVVPHKTDEKMLKGLNNNIV